MLDALSVQMVRRADPLGRTGWGPAEVRAYIAHQLSRFAEGTLPAHHLGGYGSVLPEHQSANRPAPLPKDTKKFLLDRKKIPGLDSTQFWAFSGMHLLIVCLATVL